jgi:hypothetical protein
MLLLFTSIINAQLIKAIDEEYTSIAFSIDPYASYKEKSINLSTEIILTSYFGYVKAGVQIFPGLTGGYYDITGGFGLNQKFSIFGIETKLYEGIRLGFNHRGQSIDYKPYTGPLFGIDIGFDININSNSTLGLKITNDWREDMKYSGANSKWIQSIFLTFTTKL